MTTPRRPLLILVLTLTMALSGCVTKTTRAYFLPEQMPEDLEYLSDRSFVNVLPDTLSPWNVEFSMRSVWKEAEGGQVKAGEYYIIVNFVLPEARDVIISDFARQIDTLPYVVRVDTLYLTFEKPKYNRVLTPLPDSRTPRSTRFFTAGIRGDAGPVDVRFEAEVWNDLGTRLRTKEFTFRLEQFDRKKRAWFTSD